MRSHLEQVYKQTGKKPKQLAEVGELPEELAYVWSWYAKLKAFKSELSYTEIKSWCDLSNIKFLDWELDTIVRLERINSGE